MVVFGLGKNLLFKSILGRCVNFCPLDIAPVNANIYTNKLPLKPLKVNYPKEFTLLYLLLESDLVLVECLVYLKR